MLEHPLDERPLIRVLVGEIEALREKRKQQWRDRLHPEQKRFTQGELRALACPSYHHLLQGTTQQLPSRAMVVQIADYLDCSIHETNDLLLAARYAPDVVELRTDQQAAALEQGRAMLQTLPLPAVLVSRGWCVEALNGSALAVNRLASLAQIMLEQRNSVDWMLDARLPMHPTYMTDSTIGERNARQTIAQWRTIHRPFQHEAWYRQVLARYHTLPEFASYWEQAGIVPDEPPAGPNTMMLHTLFAAEPICEHKVTITLGATVFPQIVLAVPVDEAARQVIMAQGIWTQSQASER